MIYKLTAYDLLCTNIQDGNYYVTTDTKMMYADIGNSRVSINVIFIETDTQRLNSIRPNNGTNYYVWETNTLWKYLSGWVVVSGNSSINSGFYLNSNNNIQGTSTDGVVEVIDNNGLLRDGSVVIRDANRLIKGRIYLDVNNNLSISSYMGGGLTFLPSGTADESGALIIRSAYTYVGNNEVPYDPQVTSNNGELVFHGDMYVTDGTNRFKVLTTQDGYTYVAGDGIILGDNDIYMLLYYEPSDWETNYNNYYHKESNNFVKNDYTEAPEFLEDTFYLKDTVSNEINIEDYNLLLKGVIFDGEELEIVNHKVTIPKELPAYSSSDDGKVLSVDDDGDLIWKIVPTLPSSTASDNGKVLKVNSSGNPIWDMIPTLPSVTSTDNGKILKVVNGVWDKADESGSDVPAPTSSDEGKLLTAHSDGTMTWEENSSRIIKTSLDNPCVIGAEYYLGTQSTVTINMPSNVNLGDEVLVVFMNGSTPATVTSNLSGFSYTPTANKLSWIKFTYGDSTSDTWIVEIKEN